MRFVSLAIVVIAMLSVSGCGWLFGDEGYFRDRQNDYRDARVIPPMEVDEEVDLKVSQDLYPVPETSTLLVGEFEVPRPAPLLTGEDSSLVRIQKLGDERWILVELMPSEIWPQVRNFLLGNRIGMESEDVNNGLIETSWLVLQESPQQREKYKFRIEQGIQRRSSEIYVTQIGYDSEAVGQAPEMEWPEKSLDLEREEWMVRELAVHLANAADSGSVSLMAQGLSTASKMYMIRDESGEPVIDLRLGYERAWASVGRALERGGFTVADLNRDQGVYFVRYEPEVLEEEKPGFFKRLLGRGKTVEQPGKDRQYRVKLRQVGKGVYINLEPEDGRDLADQELDHLLSAIRSNLS